MTRSIKPPASLAEAKKQFVNTEIRKYFPPSDPEDGVPEEERFQGGWFTGKVVKVEQNLPDSQGQVWEEFLYLVRWVQSPAGWG